MPKIVDHEERRAEVLEATWRVIATRGLDAATVRQIAKEAGVSSGVLAHYFTDKDDILVQAHRLAYDTRLKLVRQESARVAREWWLGVLTATAAGGHLAVDTDLGLLVDQILVFIDGVSLQSVVFPELMTPELQKQLADDLIARIEA